MYDGNPANRCWSAGQQLNLCADSVTMLLNDIRAADRQRLANDDAAVPKKADIKAGIDGVCQLFSTYAINTIRQTF
jgi:hypothetical protein